MNKLLSQFKVNTKPKLSDSIEILYDFVVVALVSLIFNGFIINNHSSVFDQKYLMVANAMLLSTQWYAYNFFRQRYEKKNSFYRILTLFSVLSLALMATGIDLMVFRENSNPDPGFGQHPSVTPGAFEYLRWIAPIILMAGYLSSRFFMSLKFTMAAIANKDNDIILKLTVWKAASRGLASLIAVAHIILLSLGLSVAITTYVFFPIYLAIELAGNLANVRDKYLAKAPDVSLGYIKQRYSKLNLLYISSFFISGTIQFAFYFKTAETLYMIPRLIMVYFTAFMIWWAYMDRMHRFTIKQDSFNLKLVAVTNIILVGSLAVIGGLLINANTDRYLDFIAPSVYIALVIYLAMLMANTKTFTNGNTEYCMSRPVKIRYIMQLVPAMVLFLILGVVTIYFTLSIWIMYGVILGVFLLLNIASRWTINKHIKLNFNS